MVILLLVPAGCSVLKIEKPSEVYNAINYAPSFSYINIPVETDSKTLKKIINREINGVIYSDTSFNNNGNDNLMIRASRSDSIELAMEGNQVSYRVPLKIWLKKRFTTGFLGYHYSTDNEANAELALKFKTTVSLNNDWTFNVITMSDGYEWISSPRLMVGSIQLPLPFIADLMVKSNLPIITKEIDKTFKESLNLRSLMNDAWTGMQKPFRISPDYPLWLKVSPVEVSSVLIRGTSAGIHHSVAIKAMIQLYYGAEPEFTLNNKLPPLKVTSSIPDNFSINFSIDIPFSQINEIARKQFTGYKFNYGKYKITILDISLYGQGENLIVAIAVDGSVKGTIYLSGKPAFNKEKMTLGFENLSFSVSTQNVLIKTAAWIFRSGLLQEFSSNLVFPIGDKLLESREAINSYLEQNQSFSYFIIKGDIEKFEPDKILVSPESVKAYFQFEGKIKVSLNAQ